MKKIVVFSIFATLFSLAYAQQPVIEFAEKEHNFGKINEEDGSVSTVFEFTNTGVAPLVINGVTASCGCTTPEWTREPIPAGGKGTVKAAFNPKGRPGQLRKSITVKSNASEPSVVLMIVGEVIPRPKTVEEQFPVQMGDIRLKTKTSPLFDIFRGQSRPDRIEIKNMSDKEVAISFANVPKHIVLEANPKKLKAQETGFIIITYNAQNVDDYGGRTDEAYVVLNGNQILTDEFKLIINSNLREDFSKLTDEQKKNAPVAEFETTQLSVDLKKGEKKQSTIALKNTGKEPLLIRKVTTSDKKLRIAYPKTVVPSKSGQIKIDVDGNNISEDLTAKVTVITNDPKNSTTTITVSVKVLK